MSIELVNKLCESCRAYLNLENIKLSDSYYYASLPLCVIDSVFSIGVNYTSTKNVVKNYCDYFKLPEYSRDLKSDEKEYTISEFIKDLRQDADSAARTIFKNRQRTSSKKGILKAEAVIRFAEVLKNNNIETFNDFRNYNNLSGIEDEIKNIPGQRSGLSFNYFCMLAGDDTRAKPDRHVLNFIKYSMGEQLSIEAAQQVLTEAASILIDQYNNISVRLLDFAIWDYMAHKHNKSKFYNKLVRDKIPEIIESSGKTCVVEILSDEDYLKMVDAKLDEELSEYHEDKNIEELADLLEVIRAAALARGYSLEDLERVRAEKAEKRGAFQKKLLLKEVKD